MKIVITNNETDILTAKDLTGLNPGLAGQVYLELQAIQDELLAYYQDEEEVE